MRLLSVNIGKAQEIEAKSGRTGIYKRGREGPVQITSLGLVDDAICDTPVHGGVDQAVYIYGQPDYDWWSETLGYDVAPGTFGENLTVSDLESASLGVGDRLLVGDVTLEITAPRVPCVTLAARMGDPAFVKRFSEAERPGVYCRVLREGSVQAGNEVTLKPYSGVRLGVLELFRATFAPKLDEETIRRFLAAPIALRERARHEAKLGALLQRREA